MGTALSIFIGLLAVARAEVGFNNEGDPIAFYSPSDGDYPAFRDGFFSVPRPTVVIDPVIFGNPEEYPDHTTIQQTGPDEVRLRIRGTVYDFLADMVADRRADIRQVRLAASASGWSREVGLSASNMQERHPFRQYYDTKPALEAALRPYPFAGRFDSGEIELQVHTGYNGISVAATNVNDVTGTSTVGITATVNRDERRYDITAEARNSPDVGLFKPILVYINDPSVTPQNVGGRHATLNGARVGLRIIDGQLQLDRPIIGLNSDPPDEIPNLVNVVGKPDHFAIRYGEHDVVFTWSYTSEHHPDASASPALARRINRRH